MRFVTYDVAIEVARGMQQPLAAMRRYRASLADQCRRALESVVLRGLLKMIDIADQACDRSS